MDMADIHAAWTGMAADGTWKPATGDALDQCIFAKTGFRQFSLMAHGGEWQLALSRVDLGSSDPRALLTVFAPGHDNSFGDLNGQVMTRLIGLYGGTNVRDTVKQLHRQLGGAEEDWQRRIDYLVAKTIRDVQGRSNGSHSPLGPLTKPSSSPYVFRNRLRLGRTVSLFGPGSSGKTTVAEALALSLITGREIVPGWLPTSTHQVAILDWDEGYEETQVRLYAINKGHNAGYTSGYHYKRMGRPLPEAADETGKWLIEHEVSVVIVSPVNRAIRQSERDPSGPIHELYEVLREFGTTNILIDHVAGAAVTGGATREYGSVAKRDNARGSYSLYQQSEEPGTRVVVIKNTKPDALASRQAPQAVRIEFDPPMPDENGTYDSITFHEDEVTESVTDVTPVTSHTKEVLHGILLTGHMTIEELAGEADLRVASVKTILYRYRGKLFDRLPSGKWEALPGE